MSEKVTQKTVLNLLPSVMFQKSHCADKEVDSKAVFDECKAQSMVSISFSVTIQNDKNLYTCTKEILKYRIAGMQMKKVQIGHTLCSPEALKTPLKNQGRQNVQPSIGCGIAKFR